MCAENSAAVMEISAKRSPIGKVAIFLIQRSPGRRSIARDSRPRRCLMVIRPAVVGGGGAGSESASSASTGCVSREAGRGPSNGSSIGGCGAAAITWCCETG